MRKMTSHGSADQMLSAFQQRLNILDDKPSDANIESATSIQATRERPSNFHKGSANQMLSAFENKIAELEGNVDSATDITASAAKKNNYVEVESNPEATDKFIHSLIDDVNSELEDLDIFDSWTWEQQDSELILTTVTDSDVQEYSIPYADLQMDESNLKEDVQYIMKAVTDEDSDEVTSATEIESSDKSVVIPASAKTEYYEDVDGVLGDVDATYSLEDLMIIWNSEFNSDPTMSQYESFDDWWQDTKQWMKSSSKPADEVDDEMFADDNGIFGNPGDIISKRDMQTYYEENHDSDPSLADYNSFEDWWSATQSMLTPVTNSTDVEASYDEVESDVWEELESKQVQDSDGFYTDYTLYKNMITGEYVCVFGDKDLYKPEDGDHDYECENESEAYEWFESYNGFGEEDDVYNATALYQNPDDEDAENKIDEDKIQCGEEPGSSSCEVTFTHDMDLEDNVQFLKNQISSITDVDKVGEDKVIVYFDHNLTPEEEVEVELSGFIKTCHWEE